MAARQQTDFSPFAGGLFLQLDMLSQLELHNSVRLHTPEVEGYNPGWAEPVIRRNYGLRHISGRPYRHLSLHSHYQELNFLKCDSKSVDFKQAVDWLNEAEAPLAFALVTSILELNPIEARRAISVLHPGVFSVVGSLCLLRIQNAEPAALATAKQRAAAVKAARDEQAVLIADKAVSHAKSFTRGMEWPLHMAWGRLVYSCIRMDRAAAKQAAAAPHPHTATPPNAINATAFLA